MALPAATTGGGRFSPGIALGRFAAGGGGCYWPRTSGTSPGEMAEEKVMAAAEGLEILAIGNAIVDVVARAGEDFLAHHGMRKGTMRLIETGEAERLYAAMPPGQESSGGSAANTAAVAALAGARAGFVGKVASDQLGAVFAHDIRAAGVRFTTLPLVGGVPTARSLILVTPDGQRTMNTYLGAAVAFSEEDLDPAEIAAAGVLYLEGYLFDPPAAQQAFRRAAAIARRAGRRVALSLSDPFCVERHRPAFLELIRDGVDILFANEAEVCSLFETGHFEIAAAAARQAAPLIALTRSERGSVVLAGVESIVVPPEPTIVVDTTGAGDAYAAGFLAALAAGRGLASAGRMGSIAAAAAIAQLGARPHTDLRLRLAALEEAGG